MPQTQVSAVYQHQDEETAMNTLIIHQHVRNYEAWRPAYDQHEPVRASAGLKYLRVTGSFCRRQDERAGLLICLRAVGGLVGTAKQPESSLAVLRAIVCLHQA